MNSLSLISFPLFSWTYCHPQLRLCYGLPAEVSVKSFVLEPAKSCYPGNCRWHPSTSRLPFAVFSRSSDVCWWGHLDSSWLTDSVLFLSFEERLSLIWKTVRPWSERWHPLWDALSFYSITAPGNTKEFGQEPSQQEQAVKEICQVTNIK